MNPSLEEEEEVAPLPDRADNLVAYSVVVLVEIGVLCQSAEIQKIRRSTHY